MRAIGKVGVHVTLAWFVANFTGCAATMAARQPGVKDLSVLQPGVPRSRVIAELGSPLATHPTDRGGVDIFAFKQGYSRTNRTARALGHATGTIVTAGFWEIAGIPLESWFDGTEVKMEVFYGPEGHVEGINVFEGAKAFRGHIPGQHVYLAESPAPGLSTYTAYAPSPPGSDSEKVGPTLRASHAAEEGLPLGRAAPP